MGNSEEKDSIEFLAKYKNWIAIKKMSISDDVKPEEIAFHLASIRQTIDKKAFEILGIDTSILDEEANKITGGARKSFKSLAEAISSLSSEEAREAVQKACKGKEELQEVANAYLLRKVVQNLGFDFDVNQEMLAKVYPELKIPKPLGRKPKA
jgi:hypothetical protein